MQVETHNLHKIQERIIEIQKSHSNLKEAKDEIESDVVTDIPDGEVHPAEDQPENEEEIEGLKSEGTVLVQNGDAVLNPTLSESVEVPEEQEGPNEEDIDETPVEFEKENEKEGEETVEETGTEQVSNAAEQ